MMRSKKKKSFRALIFLSSFHPPLLQLKKKKKKKKLLTGQELGEPPVCHPEGAGEVAGGLRLAEARGGSLECVCVWSGGG